VTPAKLRIWGGMGYCDKRELLYETALITNNRWITTTMRLQPKRKDCRSSLSKRISKRLRPSPTTATS